MVSCWLYTVYLLAVALLVDILAVLGFYHHEHRVNYTFIFALLHRKNREMDSLRQNGWVKVHTSLMLLNTPKGSLESWYQVILPPAVRGGSLCTWKMSQSCSEVGHRFRRHHSRGTEEHSPCPLQESPLPRCHAVGNFHSLPGLELTVPPGIPGTVSRGLRCLGTDISPRGASLGSGNGKQRKPAAFINDDLGQGHFRTFTSPRIFCLCGPLPPLKKQERERKRDSKVYLMSALV